MTYNINGQMFTSGPDNKSQVLINIALWISRPPCCTGGGATTQLRLDMGHCDKIDTYGEASGWAFNEIVYTIIGGKEKVERERQQVSLVSITIYSIIFMYNLIIFICFLLLFHCQLFI